MELDNGLISYYDNPRTARVRQLILRVVPVNFILVMMLACHASPLAGHSHEQRTLCRILSRFLGPMVNKEVVQFIRAYTHCQFVNSCSHEAHQLLRNIESDTPFDVVFLDFWEPGDIPDRDRSRKILTCLDCMRGFGLGSAIGLREITSDQAAQ